MSNMDISWTLRGGVGWGVELHVVSSLGCYMAEKWDINIPNKYHRLKAIQSGFTQKYVCPNILLSDKYV